MNNRIAPLWLSGSLLVVACGNTGAPAIQYGPLLSNVSEQVVLPEHQMFASQADALVAAIQTMSDAPSTDSLTAAQAAWRDARGAFRTLDSLHFGPGYTLHITERIDVLPPVDVSGIEAMVTGSGAVDDAAVANAGGHKKGFLGLEYLLFSSDVDSPAPVLVGDTAAPRRRALAVSMADEIAKSAHQLDDAWEPGKGGYATQLTLAGAGGTVYPTQRAAVDDLVAGSWYAIEQVVHYGLGQPLGRTTGTAPDPSTVITARSDNALNDMLASLGGVRAIYDGDGLSAVIKSKSAALDGVVLSELDTAQTKLQAIPTPFVDSLVNDTSTVQSAYDAVKTLKDTWNADLASALGATIRTGELDGD